MPEEAIKETLTYKSEEERLQALRKFEGDPPREQEEEQKRVMEAEIVPEEEAAPETPVEDVVEPQAPEEIPPEPQVPEELPQEESQIQPEASEEPPPKEEDVVQFSYKREDLPDSLKVYKDPEEIIRQADHARTYANKVEIKMKEMAAEKEKMEAKLKEYEELKAQDVSKAPEVSPEVLQPETHVDELAVKLQKIEDMEDSDYMTKADIKDVFDLYSKQNSKQMANNEKMFNDLKSDFGGKLTGIEDANKANAKKDEVERQKEAVVRGINELQDAYPELKTNKAVSSIMGDTDCVERDVMQWADRLLFSKYGNDKPNWTHRNAVVNAYLEGNPEVEAYCRQNAITPESVGMAADDMRKYATIMNIDANMRGEEIDKITGERKQKISPFNGNPVNYDSYIASYKGLKDSAGITQQEHKEEVVNAELRGQQSLGEAMEVRADTPKTLGGKGALAPEAVKEMTEEKAWSLINNVDEFAMETQALAGNRSLFHEYNKALKIVKFPEEKPSPHWPVEK